jgi:hypothetical protein
MARLDVPEILILALLAAAGVWALYNRTHPDTHSSK